MVRPPYRPDEYDTHLDSRVIFGSSAGVSATDSEGNESNIPTKWHSPKPTRQYIHQHLTSGQWVDVNEVLNRDLAIEPDINNRFHGIYWVYAQVVPCGNQFREQVTHGRLRHVPITEFKMKMDESEVIPYHVTEGMIGSIVHALRSSPLSFVRASEDFTYSDPLHKELYYSNGSAIRHRYMDEYSTTYNQVYDNYIPDYQFANYGTRPYIKKPKGWVLKDLVWRCFCTEANALVHTDTNDFLITTTPMFDCVCDQITTERGADDIILPFYEGFCNYGYLHPYNEEGIGFVDYYNTTDSRDGIDFYDDDDGVRHYYYTYISQTRGRLDQTPTPVPFKKALYAHNNGYNLLERSVNGNGRKSFIDPDSGDLLYFPTMTQNQVQQLIARNSQDMNELNFATWDTPIRGSLYNASSEEYNHDRGNTYTYYTNYRLFLAYDFDYIAVWTPEEI